MHNSTLSQKNCANGFFLIIPQKIFVMMSMTSKATYVNIPAFLVQLSHLISAGTDRSKGRIPCQEQEEMISGSG